METLTGYTTNEVKKDYTRIFREILEKTKMGQSWIHMFTSFEQYYFIVQKTIEYYTEQEDYKSCNILKAELSKWIDKIPKNTNEAIKFLIESTHDINKTTINQLETFSLAINMHKTTGAMIIDLWLLRFQESPLRQYYEKEHKIKNHDQIANDILMKYIEAYKAKVEAE